MRALMLPAAILVAAGAVLAGSPSAAPALSDTPRNAELPAAPCATEDSAGPCFWDAGRAGNGRGFSFWVDSAQTVHYLDARR